jgi:hypothetical protein
VSDSTVGGDATGGSRHQRKSIAAAALFLLQKSLRLNAKNSEVEAFTMRCAQGELSLDEIADWFEGHSRH